MHQKYNQPAEEISSDNESEKELFDTRTPYENVEVALNLSKNEVEVDFEGDKKHAR